MPSFPELLQPLSDGVVELRLAREWDIPDILIAHQDDPELYRRLGLDRPPSGAELGRRAETEPADRAAGTELRLTILETDDQTCRGQIDVHRVDWNGRSAELGIWLAPQVRGQGVARRALRLAAGWLFGACELERLTLNTDNDNQPMIRAARAAGFIEPDRTPPPAGISLTLVRPLPGPPTASGA
jgi:RimJ/RimL family protein N-acetyltransferase